MTFTAGAVTIGRVNINGINTRGLLANGSISNDIVAHPAKINGNICKYILFLFFNIHIT